MIALYRILACTAPILLTTFAVSSGNCDRALRRLEGWTVVKVSSINGEFEGCDYHKPVELIDGTILRCSSYGYQYGYMPDAVLFAKTIKASGQAVVMLRLLVDGELYDMLPMSTRR